MSKKQKQIIILAGVVSLAFGIAPNVNAMHIMEGYLPAGFCIAWGVLCIPFLLAGFWSIKRTLNEHRNLMTLLAMSGAFIFVISSLKIPSVTGSCSHMTGTGLGAILFGPSAVSILGLIVLLFQAILLAHGGLTTLGANTFSMAIAGPFVSYGIFAVCRKTNVNKKVSIFLAAALGDLFTYCVTACQMALAHNADTTFGAALGKFLLVFAPTQVPLAIIEGIITVVIVMGLETYAKPELRAIGYLKETK
ncbi:MAG: energy-coupling factor ABC transporter permease [Lachnospiraceae bacterium]